MYQTAVKPLFDFVSALMALLILLPIFLILIMVLFIEHHGKPFFVQRRAGHKGKVFYIYKLKSMNDKKDKNGVLLPFNKRVTKLGQFIRKYSLDEIPQIFNVLKGEMSIVGPRPLHVEYLPLYDDNQRKRHDVLPGITGWAQVNGRNAISWEQKFIYDVWYVNNQSFLLDLKILLKTFSRVLSKTDINNSESINMPAFKNAKIG